ncbi:MAG: glucose 1-dehydrogenase [Intrasporangium sp.]|uniref:SDR family NAD(P)-dependent oxidoreductase n=1 Tax=Intrasporangium sp. TaxID=1925024 RepID=UPI0026499A67|nr:glucose 1-dehydrogenase [Intrasporangium sp.]MDN5796014.1 glucose 1-dehydrogenase [Intrasporangium sp.]
MGIMDGKSGLVTASGGGIGRASALAFARAGANVLVSDIDEATARETAELIRAAGGTAESLVADASDEAANLALVQAVVAHWGRLDFAHNNAGIGSPNKPLTEQEGEDWERIFRINVFGMMYAVKHQLRQFLRQGDGGAIVNSASTAGVSGSTGLSPYVSSKWAVLGLTKTAAAEVAADGIRVNAICPGATLTDALQGWKESSPDAYEAVASRIPMRRMADAAEQADAAVWLCSPQASYVTGQALAIDGGDTILGH